MFLCFVPLDMSLRFVDVYSESTRNNVIIFVYDYTRSNIAQFKLNKMSKRFYLFKAIAQREVPGYQ